MTSNCSEYEASIALTTDVLAKLSALTPATDLPSQVRARIVDGAEVIANHANHRNPSRVPTAPTTQSRVRLRRKYDVVGRDQVLILDANSCVRRPGRISHSLQIRTAKVADLAAIVACSDLAFNSFARHTDNKDGKSADHLQSEILDGSIRLICDGNSVLGYIAIWPAAGQMFVDTLAVLPKHQRRGLGSQLLAFADSETRRLGLKTVNLFTKATMVENLEFYRRRGYSETGRCDDDGFCRVFYTKHVSAETVAPIAATAQCL